MNSLMSNDIVGAICKKLLVCPADNTDENGSISALATSPAMLARAIPDSFAHCVSEFIHSSIS